MINLIVLLLGKNHVHVMVKVLLFINRRCLYLVVIDI